MTRALLAATLTTKSSKNYLDGQYLSVSSRKLTILDLDGNLNTSFAGGVLSLDLGYAQGLDALGAMKDLDNLPDSASRAQFSKFKYGFYYSLPFSVLHKDFGFTSQLSGQKSNNVLYGSEQIQIGGLYSVRGFVNNVLAGDDGYYWRNEISMRQPVTIGSETINGRIYAGYDTGEVRNIAPNIPQGRLSGMAIGMSVNWRGASWDLFTAWPLSLPGNMTKESSQTWFRVAYAL
jgi:hemolysin activation/secretion protein